jgi:hypothetical protein
MRGEFIEFELTWRDGDRWYYNQMDLHPDTHWQAGRPRPRLYGSFDAYIASIKEITDAPKRS